MLTAKDIMTTDIITVQPEMPVEELAGILLRKKISGVPVIDSDGNLVGVATESDLIDQTKNVHIPTVVTILDSFIFLENPSKLDEEIKKMTGTTVNDICTKKPLTVDEETPLDKIASIMAEKKIHTLPVMREGNMVGVIGKADIIKTIAGG